MVVVVLLCREVWESWVFEARACRSDGKVGKYFRVWVNEFVIVYNLLIVYY